MKNIIYPNTRVSNISDNGNLELNLYRIKGQLLDRINRHIGSGLGLTGNYFARNMNVFDAFCDSSVEQLKTSLNYMDDLYNHSCVVDTNFVTNVIVDIINNHMKMKEGV